MAQVDQNIAHILGTSNAFYPIGQLILLLLLLTASAFFSGTETAFFNLSRRQIKLLSESKHKLQNLTTKLLSRPKQLLSCLLLGNMMVNVCFFAITSVLTLKIERQFGPASAVFGAFVAFSVLVLFGETLPKSVAYANSRSVSVAASMPLFLCVKVFTPIIFVFHFFIAEPVLRLLLGPTKPTKPITAAEFKTLIDQVRQRGLITADENRLLAEIVDFGFLKVRHVMRPRVDMVACAITESNQKLRKTMQENHLTKLPVYTQTIDNIIGLINLRQLLLQPDAHLEKLVQPVDFVPEQKTVESLLEFFRKTGTDTAIAVDEYGGIAGSVCLEDIAEELLGPIEITNGIEPIKQIGTFEYRLTGGLAIHDWAQSFGINLEKTRISTIAGLVTALLGRVPKSGDVAHLKNLKFTVECVQKHRIETILLTLELPANDDK